METVLKVENLQIGLKNKGHSTYPVEHVSFEIGKGETLALVGESGSGKSMTALSIMGLLQSWNSYLNPQIKGQVHFRTRDGKESELIHLTEKEYDKIRGKDISMIFQEPLTVLNPVIMVGKQIMEVIMAHETVTAGEARDRSVNLLEQVGIEDARARFFNYPHQFSGGQLQRIVIAMAIACDASCLIADEPTTALDVTIQAQILKLLARLQRERQMSILLITHDFGVVSEFAHKVAVMYSGNIVEYGAVSDIFVNPVHPYTKLLISSIPTMATVPGSRLLTKKDFLSAEGGHGGSHVFDPDNRQASSWKRIKEGHYISSAFMKEVYA